MQNNNNNFFSKVFSITNIIIVLILLLISFFVWNKTKTITEESKPVTLILNESDHSVGNKNAKVTIVEYADFQCPACKAFESITTPLLAEYSDKINFVFKYFPLIQIHQNAILSAEAAEAASKQGKFWEMKKILYEKQDEWANALDAKTKIISYAVSIGLDSKKFEVDLKDKSTEDRVLKDLKEANSLKLNGTPSFIINGIKVDTGKISSVEQFKKYIDTELEKLAEVK